MYDESTRNAVYAAILSGLDDRAVADVAGVNTRSVPAFRAHVTMGRATTKTPVEFSLTKAQRRSLASGHPIVFS